MRFPWRPRFQRLPKTSDDVFGKWLISWYVVPGIYMTIASFRYKYSEEIRIHVELGRGSPSRRHLHVTFTKCTRES